MIAIVNVGPHNNPDLGGERNYEVRINHTVITTFKHKRRDGLATCLSLAADAVRQHERDELVTMILNSQETP